MDISELREAPEPGPQPQPPPAPFKVGVSEVREAPEPESHPAKRLRLACDTCHSAKIRCSGGCPCKKCENSNIECQYSYTAKLGKPKGSRNKKTLAKLNDLANTSAAAATTTNANTTTTGPNNPSDVPLQPKLIHPLPSTELVSLSMSTDQSPGMNDSHEDLYIPFDIPIDPTLLSEDLFNPKFSGQFLDDDLLAALGASSSPSNSAGSKDLDSDTTLGTLFGHKPQKEDSPLAFPTATSNPCSCLPQLTEQLCLLNSTERKNTTTISPDIILSKAHQILYCFESVLACPFCRLDPTVLQLAMTMLQTLFNWTRVDYLQHYRIRQSSPPVYFGRWKISEEDSRQVKLLLTKRALVSSRSIVNMLRLRMDEIQLLGQRQMRYQYMDTDNMQNAIDRLASSLADIEQLVQQFSEIKESPVCEELGVDGI